MQGESIRLPHQVDTALFRIVQEALTNVAKHAGATKVNVAVEMKPLAITLVVEDNGRGFEIDRTGQREPSGWGILGIRERAKLLGAECRIDSVPGEGTRVEIHAPLVGEDNAHVQTLTP